MTGAHRSRNPSFVSTNDGSPSSNAALYGAAKAFAASTSPNTALSMCRNDSATNGAYSAADRAGIADGKHPTASPHTSLKASNTGSHRMGRDEATRARTNTLNASLETPARNGLSRSPSSIAASLAASRASPSSSTPSLSPTGKQLNPPIGKRSTSLTVAAGHRFPSKPRISLGSQIRSDGPDESPIPPTSSLRQLFEQKDKSAKVTESQQSLGPPPNVAVARSSPIQSPKPVHNSLILKDDAPPMPMFEDEQTKMPASPPQKLGDTTSLKVPKVRSADLSGNGRSSINSAKPTPPPARRRGKAGNTGTPDLPPPDPVTEAKQRQPSLDARRTAPIPIKPSRTPVPQGPSFEQPRSLMAQYNQLHPRRITPLTTGDSLAQVDSLANAIVASSLASTRAPSPTKPPSLPSRSHPHHHHHHTLFSHTPSPPKRGMRHTMRSNSSSSSSGEEVPFAKHKKKRVNIVRKHPNKHHEGSRKRWRDAVTERERKRYEGVWAANKGLHVSLCSSESLWLEKYPHSKESLAMLKMIGEEVSNVVVRDIWSRSRMPQHVLEEVWSLVDTKENGRLTKEEFVVGLWLVDQRLKGRKLPVKVSESVWKSVKFLQGIKIR